MIDVSVLSVCVPESTLKTALDKVFNNSFGNQLNQQIYDLQLELEKYQNEYGHMRNQISKDPLNVSDNKYSDKGMGEVLNLNILYNDKKIELKSSLPIKIKLLDCFSSNDRRVLEKSGIIEWDIVKEEKK